MRKRSVRLLARRYGIDRIAGEFISAQPFSIGTEPKGIDEKTGRPMVNPEAHYGSEGSPISRGWRRRHDWSAMPFNPNTRTRLYSDFHCQHLDLRRSRDSRITGQGGAGATGHEAYGGLLRLKLPSRRFHRSCWSSFSKGRG